MSENATLRIKLKMQNFVTYKFLNFLIIFGMLTFNQILAASIEEEESRSKIIKSFFEIKNKYQIKDYPTYLKFYSSQSEKEFFLDIYSENETKIGDITLQYYSHGDDYYPEKGGKNPIIRLVKIRVQENYQKQGHAGRAIETMFTALRKNGKFTENTEVWLEYDKGEQKFLEKFYAGFGFVDSGEPSWSTINIVKVNLSKSKFPYYGKSKKS